MRVGERAADGLPIIEVCGEVDRANSSDLQAMVDARMASGEHRLLFDFSDCSFIDSSVLGMLMNVIRDVGAEGLIGCIAPRPSVMRLLAMTGLTDLPTLRIFEDPAAALAYLAALN